MEYLIRRAEPGDTGGIAEVARRTWHATYAGLIPEALQAQMLAAWYSADGLARSIANPRGAFFVAATDAGQVVGYANASPRPEPGDVELWRIYILPEQQRHGLGRRLIQATLEALRPGRPVERLYVQVERGNALGRRAYEAMGFTYIRDYDNDFLGHVTTMTEMCLNVANP